MRAIILAILALVMIAAPVASQSPEPSSAPAPTPIADNPLSTWDDFQREVASDTAYVEEWQADLNSATAADEVKLLWAELLARRLDHLARLQNIPIEDCFHDYAYEYIDYLLWINQYIAGVYLVTTAPDIEPPSDESAQMILLVAQINAAGTGNKLKEVSCDDAAAPSSPSPLA